MHSDAAALFENVRLQHPDVVIIGRSLGTGVAVRLASQSPVSRLVLITPYDSAADIGEHAFPFIPVRWLLRDKYDSGKYAQSIKIPTTIIEAENDKQIPHSSTERLFARFDPGVATLTKIEGVGHNDLEKNKKYGETLQGALQ